MVCVQTPQGGIELREPGLDRIEAALDSGDTLVAHNACFDALACIASRPRLLPKFFKAYEENRVECTKVREMLIRNATGDLKRYRYNLLSCLKARKISHDFEVGDKESDVRTSYSKLDGVPVDEWPEAYRRYALADLVVEDLYIAQEGGPLADQHRQARADFVLALTSAWGMRTDPEAVRAFSRKIDAEHKEIRAFLTTVGLVRVNGKRDTKEAKAAMVELCKQRDIEPELTESGAISLNADACIAAAGSDKHLKAFLNGEPFDQMKAALPAYARYTSVGNLRARTDRLIVAGDLPIQPRFNVLVESGRTSCSTGNVKPGQRPVAFGDQTQNPHRETGVREGYRARDGYVLCSVDWSAAELHSLAQVCVYLGFDSEMASVLNKGIDPHLNFASKMKDWDYEWAKANKKSPEVKDARQAAKACNFGFPGGLGVSKFRLFAAKSYNVELTEREANELKQWWLRVYPEMPFYFGHINQLGDEPLVQIYSKRERGKTTYCSAANSYFQGLTADMAKDAGFDLAKEAYLDTASPLYGARPWNFVHDEWIYEIPSENADAGARRMVEIMEAAGAKWCPDVPVRAEPALQRSWRKGAEPVYDDSGRLICWEDRPLPEEPKANGLDPIYVAWEYGVDKERVVV